MKAAPLLYNPHPGETLKEALGDLGITHYRLAQDTGLPHSRITTILAPQAMISYLFPAPRHHSLV